MESNERLAAFVENGALHVNAINRVGPIEDNEPLSVFRGGLQGQSHRGNVGVKTRPDVLDVEHEGIDLSKLLGGRSACLGIQAVDAQSR